MPFIWGQPGKHSSAPEHHSVTFLSPSEGLEPAYLGELVFQDGPVTDYGHNGVTNEDVLEAVIERLQALNKPPFACRENALAITHMQEALFWLEYRTRERQKRGVESTDKP